MWSISSSSCSCANNKRNTCGTCVVLSTLFESFESFIPKKKLSSISIRLAGAKGYSLETSSIVCERTSPNLSLSDNLCQFVKFKGECDSLIGHTWRDSPGYVNNERSEKIIYLKILNIENLTRYDRNAAALNGRGQKSQGKWED